MGLDWTTKLIKYVLFLVNLLFVISGIILIAVGATIKTYYNKYDLFLSNKYFDLANLLIAIGALIFIFSAVGCYGTFSEKWLIIFGFSILCAIIFIMEFSGGIAGFVLKDATKNYLSEKLIGSMKDYDFNSEQPNDVTTLWDTVQRHFECCGANSPEDWSQFVPSTSPVATSPTTTPTTTTINSNTSTTLTPTTTPTTTTINSNTNTTLTPTTTTTTTTSNSTNGENNPFFSISRNETLDLPVSCCTPNPGTTGSYVCNLNSTTASYYPTGCVTYFGNYLKSHAATLGGTAIGIAVFQLLGAILSYHLSMKLRNGLVSS